MKTLFSFSLLVFIISACGDSKVSGPTTVKEVEQKTKIKSDSPAEDPSVTAFSKTLAPLLEEHCSTCHGIFQSPLFALIDQSEANHETLLNHPSELVSLETEQSAESSRIITKLQTQNHHCWSNSCDNDAQDFFEQILAWKLELEKEAPPDNEDNNNSLLQISISIPLPAGLQQIGSSGLRLRFPLTDVYEGARDEDVFEIELERFDAGSYRVYRPKIMTSSTVSIKRPIVRINNEQITPHGNFSFIDRTVNPTNGSFELLSSLAVLAAVDRDVPGDEISIEFELIEQIP